MILSLDPASERLRPHWWQRGVGTIILPAIAWGVAGSTHEAGSVVLVALLALWLVDLPSAVLITLVSTALLGSGPPGQVASGLGSVSFLMVMVVVTLYDRSALRRRARLGPRHLRLLAFVSLVTISYATLLYRASGTERIHCAALAFTIVLSFRDVPGWSSPTWLGQLVVRAAIVAAAVASYPMTPFMTDLYSRVIKPSLVRFSG